MVVLGDLPGGGSNGFATGMSADGSVVSGQSTSTSGTEAFVWTASGGMVGLGDLPGGAFDSSAWAVSADGLALAGDGTTAAGREAFVWTAAGGLVPLGYLPGGGAFSGAHGVSSHGTYVAGASDSFNASPGNVEAFRWSAAGGMVGLGELDGGAAGSFANGISADGQVIVGGSETSLGTEAYVWTPSCGMRNLKSYLLSLGVGSVASWTLQNAHGVSADGTTIVGYGINPSGQTEPWIAHVPICVLGAGTVPDGSSVPGAPLAVDKSAGGAIVISWSSSCRPTDVDYAVYEGLLGDFGSHAPRLCTTGGATTATFVPGDGNRYYLVVPSDGAVEGSYGRTSAALERAASATACFGQAIASCP
jgi:probable HAF family extracellular repeat protein